MTPPISPVPNSGKVHRALANEIANRYFADYPEKAFPRILAILQKYLLHGRAGAVPTHSSETLRATAHKLLRRFMGVYDTGDLEEAIAILSENLING